MNDIFNTFTVRIGNRNDFNRARELSTELPTDGLDIGQSDMIFSFGDETVFNSFVEKLKRNDIDIL